MPGPFLTINVLFFSDYVFALNRGRINILRSARDFRHWARNNPGGRTPIRRPAQAYIRACGGQVWK